MTRPDPSLRDDLHQLRADLDADLDLLRGSPALAPLGRRHAELGRYLDDLDAQLERSSSAAVITLVGSTGAGKSTLLNALAGAPVAHPGTDRPTTTRPAIYKPRNADVTSLVQGLRSDGIEVTDYAPAEGARGTWTEQVLVDAPDTNSVATEHRDQVELLAERSDALVIVAHRQSVAELASVEFVDAFSGRRDLCFVLNRADELSAEAQATLIAQLRELAAERWGAPDAPVFATSAAQAFAAEQREPGSASREVPGWKELIEHLTELVSEKRLGRVRRDNALGTTARIAELFRELQADVEPRLASLVEDTSAATADFRMRVSDELDERLELRRRDISLLLFDETARHWEGPGGWALRAGGLSGMGLAAGAMVARKNPLIAAGAAVGATALDRAQGALRSQRIERASGLVPTGHELEAWYRESFTTPRHTSLELFGEPTALGLPTAGGLAAEAAAAIESAWQRLVERDLVAAASRGSRWYLRWPVDLPVYALVAWLVYQSALGFYAGTSLGFDRLVDASILVLAWLFIARWIVRRVLGGLGRGLVAGVGAAAQEALDRTEEQAPAEHSAAIAARRGALARLADLDNLWRERLHRTP